MVVHKVLLSAARRRVGRRGLFWKALVQRTRGPGAAGPDDRGANDGRGFRPEVRRRPRPLGPRLLIGFVALVGSAMLAALHVGAVVYSRRFKVDVEDNLVARKHLTQVRILERTAAAFIILLTLAAALMTIGAVRQYGVTLLASAGAAGIIAGLALRPLLTNLIAGIQIAVTQPIRIDDAVIVEDEWRWIEEISATYVVRLSGLRRMLVP